MSAALPTGHNVTGVTTDEAGGLTTVWADGRESGPTISIEAAVIFRQRARAIAARSFIRNVRLPNSSITRTGRLIHG